MNIRQAKEYIKDTVKLYLKKDGQGEYRISVVRQRPIFLLGAPGIGKTAVMEQIAQELGIALVSYAMTHHTRQSALGLPVIRRKTYDGQEYDVSEYTMSEIIASVYDVMEKSGIREGILFLDEINCVSETLYPSMLQFLQYKVFGRHQVPQGWVVVTAGNPPEYNRSVREFDVVTMDRIRVLDVEPDYGAWKEYAKNKGLHGAVVSYLDLKKEDFYRIETTADGRSYVTARGWEDLSEILKLYEEEGLAADEKLVGQYLRNERIVREFTAYYDLYRKYQRDYPIEEILQGGPQTARSAEKAKEAPFDERLSLLGMLLDNIQADIRETMEAADYLTGLVSVLKGAKAAAQDATSGQMNLAGKQDIQGKKEKTAGETSRMEEFMRKQEESRRTRLQARKDAGAESEEEKRKQLRIIRFLQEGQKLLRVQGAGSEEDEFEPVRAAFELEKTRLKRQTERVQTRLHNLFAFTEEAFGEGNELLILMTELTVNAQSARFLAAFGCSDYQRHSQEMMLSERQSRLAKEIADLHL